MGALVVGHRGNPHSLLQLSVFRTIKKSKRSRHNSNLFYSKRLAMQLVYLLYCAVVLASDVFELTTSVLWRTSARIIDDIATRSLNA